MGGQVRYAQLALLSNLMMGPLSLKLSVTNNMTSVVGQDKDANRQHSVAKY